MTVCGNVTLSLQSFKSCILHIVELYQVASGNNIAI